MAKLFTREEIKKRNTKKDAVFVIHNDVYEVTSFLDSHPGGEEVLLEKSGTDASENFEDVGHSSDAREMMKNYKIGEVVEADRVEVKQKSQAWGEESTATTSNSWVLPLVLGIIATVIYRYFFNY